MGGRAGGGAGLGSGSRGGLARSLSKRENEIKDSPFERMSIFDKKGKELFRNEHGDANSVSFKGGEKYMRDNIYTHNHPGDSATPHPSFSEGDYVAAVTYNVKEMRAVAHGVTYSLKRPKTGWRVPGKDMQGMIGAAFRDAKQKASSRLKYYVMNYKGDKRQALARADRLMSHMVNKMVAKKLGYEYSKTKTK